MGIQATTARDAELTAKRQAFMGRHRLRDYKLSGRHLMKMVLTSGGDKAAVDRVRERFTYSYGCSLRWHGPTWDHLEMMGRGGQALVMVSHPYSIDDEGRRDISLFRAAGLRVVIGVQGWSWYGYGTHQVRVEHPAFSGEVDCPATPRIETHREARILRAAPDLLNIARTFAVQLADAMRLCPCTGRDDGAPCVHCLMRDDFARITAVIAEAEGTATEEDPR